MVIRFPNMTKTQVINTLALSDLIMYLAKVINNPEVVKSSPKEIVDNYFYPLEKNALINKDPLQNLKEVTGEMD